VISGVLRSAGILIVTVLAAASVSAVSLLSNGDRIPSAIMRWWGRAFVRIGGWKVHVSGLDHLPPGGAVLVANGERIPSAIMRWWGRAFVRIGGWKVHVSGLDHLPPGGAVLAANHQSLVDIPLFIAAIPRDVRFLAKRELGRIPVFGRAMTRAGNLLIDREDARDAVRLVRAATEGMSRGRMVVIFPEGTRSVSGAIGEFKAGAFFLAQKTGVPVVPVLIEGGGRALPKGSLRFRPSVLVVRVLPPLTGEAGSALSRGEMARETRRRILSARGEGAPSPGAVLA
jgi:1-acyl-sn-glycerol-3-phosphate acyltransferase